MRLVQKFGDNLCDNDAGYDSLCEFVFYVTSEKCNIIHIFICVLKRNCSIDVLKSKKAKLSMLHTFFSSILYTLVFIFSVNTLSEGIFHLHFSNVQINPLFLKQVTFIG